MNKAQRDERIAVEANTHILGSHHHPDKGDEFDAYIAGTNSKANLEFIVRRAWELTQSSIEPSTLPNGQPCEIIGPPQCDSPDEIIAVIAKELKADK